MFEKYITPISFIKKETVNLSSEELKNTTDKLASVLTSNWMKFIKYTHLESRETTDLNTGEVITKPEVYSFQTFRWFINVSSNWTVYYKHNNKFNTIAKITPSGLKFNESGKQFIPEFIKEQNLRIPK